MESGKEVRDDDICVTLVGANKEWERWVSGKMSRNRLILDKLRLVVRAK